MERRPRVGRSPALSRAAPSRFGRPRDVRARKLGRAAGPRTAPICGRVAARRAGAAPGTKGGSGRRAGAGSGAAGWELRSERGRVPLSRPSLQPRSGDVAARSPAETHP